MAAGRTGPSCGRFRAGSPEGDPDGSEGRASNAASAEEIRPGARNAPNVAVRSMDRQICGKGHYVPINPARPQNSMQTIAKGTRYL